MDHDNRPTPAQAEEIRDTPPDESTWIGLGLAWEMGYTIAIPAVVFCLAGAWSDKQFGTSPLFVLLGIAVAFVISFTIIAGKIREINSRLPKTLPKKPDPIDEHLVEGHDFHENFRPKP